MPLNTPPAARVRMRIRRPVAEVYRAFVDPAITRRFWFSDGSDALAVGRTATWHWAWYGVSVQVGVRALEPDARILIEWPTPVEWTFTPKGPDATDVVITASGFGGSDDEQVARAIDAMGGFAFALAGCKAWLEHGIDLRLTADHDPDHHVAPRT